MPVEYNRSDNATRDYVVTDELRQHGKSRIQIRCPFCGTRSWAFLWSLYGGGKRCENNRCGAKFAKGGYARPVVGRENMTPATAPVMRESQTRPGRRSDYRR
jgi:hypothetical protein